MVKGGHKPLARSLRLYERIALGFVAVTFFLLLSVLYLSVSRATIKVLAKTDVISTEAIIDIVPEAQSVGQVSGQVKQTEVKLNKIITLPEEGSTPVPGKSTGLVMISNNTNNSQPLVATTRLLSKEGVLFRLKDYVVVPARGSVEATVVADQPGKEGDLPPTQFIIPGLSTTLQSQITAVSTAPMEGGVSYVRLLTQNDIDVAINSLREEAISEAQMELTKDVPTEQQTGAAYNAEVVTYNTDVPVGQEVGLFALALTVRVSAVFYDSELVKTLASSMLKERVTEGFDLYGVNRDAIQIKVDSVDNQSGTARLSLYLDGKTVISPTSPALDKDRFLGRSPKEAITLLKSSDGIQDATVTFTPFWLKRIPTLKDHIEIQIEAAPEALPDETEE